MSAPSRRMPPPRGEVRIVDVVFERTGTGVSKGLAMSLVFAVGVHTVVWLWARSAEQSLETWSAEVAARVHAELGHQEIVELAKPTPPEPPPDKLAEDKPAVPDAPAPQNAPRTVAPRQAQAAQAGQLVTREPDSHAPLDLTGNNFTTGTAKAYSGGANTRTGTHSPQAPPRGVEPATASAPGSTEPDRTSPVGLQAGQWHCAWPTEADDEQVNEQAVILRVVVSANGTAESVKLESDPGHGFGPKAIACALRTRFTPARDRQGRPIKAQSPPIRVRFTR